MCFCMWHHDVQLQVSSLEVRKRKFYLCKGLTMTTRHLTLRWTASLAYRQRWAVWFCWPHLALSSLPIAAVLNLSTTEDKWITTVWKGLAWDLCTSGRQRVEWCDNACYTQRGAHSQRPTLKVNRQSYSTSQTGASCCEGEPEVFSLTVWQWQNQPVLLECPTSTESPEKCCWMQAGQLQ